MTKLNVGLHSKQVVIDTLAKQGIDHYGFARLGRPLSIDFYAQWLTEKNHGEMHYLERHFEDKHETHYAQNKIQVNLKNKKYF